MAVLVVCQVEPLHYVRAASEEKFVLDENEEEIIGARTGIMGYGDYSASTLLSTKLRVTGYPADKSGVTMWRHARKINSVSDKILNYNIDTAGGQSGAPAYIISNNQVVGVHSRADDPRNPTENLGRRINSVLFRILQRRKKEDK